MSLYNSVGSKRGKEIWSVFFLQWHRGQKTNLQHPVLTGCSAIRAGLWHCTSGLWECFHSLCPHVRRRARWCDQPDAWATQPGGPGNHGGGRRISLQAAPMVRNVLDFSVIVLWPYKSSKLKEGPYVIRSTLFKGKAHPKTQCFYTYDGELAKW